MKLTKEAAKQHEYMKTLILSAENGNPLRSYDVDYILDHYREDAEHMNNLAGAFFTPYEIARDFAIEIPSSSKTVLDIGAGIGRLSQMAALYSGAKITCIEINPEYLRVGKILFPQFEWIAGDAIEVCKRLAEENRHFDTVISNPPYGSVRSMSVKPPRYRQAQAQFKVIDAAADIADYGVFILPQMSVPFVYSGHQHYEERKNNKAYNTFSRQTGLVIEHNCGIDLAQYKNLWNGTSMVCEVGLVDYKEWRASNAKKRQPDLILSQL